MGYEQVRYVDGIYKISGMPELSTLGANQEQDSDESTR
jgi:hypothetical protein